MGQTPEQNNLKSMALAQVARQAELLRGIARELHANPETGLNEHRSAALLADTLERRGFTVQRGIAGMATAFPLARSLDIKPGAKTTVDKLIATTEDSLAASAIGPDGAVDP